MTDETKVPYSKIFIAIFAAVAIIIGGIFLFGKIYTPKSPYETVEYGGFEFQKLEGLWYTQWQHEGQVYNIPLRFNPYEVELISVQGELNDVFANARPFYITFDPLEEDEDFKYLALGAAELSLNLVRGLQATVQAACTKAETEACTNRSIVTCNDKDKAVILLKAEEPTQVLLKDNCLILQGKDMNLLKAVDRALYHFYNIMP